MRNFLILLKVNFINNLRINRFLKKKKGKTKVALISLLFIVALLFFMGIGFLYYMMFADILKAEGKVEYILLIASSFGAFMLVMQTIVRADGHLFKARDYDMLMSMPINQRDVVFSKVLSLLFADYLFFSIFFIPGVIVYGVHTGFTAWLIIYGLISLVVTPLLPISIFSFLSYFVSIITRNWKYKNIFKIIIMFLFVVGIMMISITSQNMEDNPGQFAESMFNSARAIYYPGYLNYLGFMGNIGAALLYIGLNVGFFSIFVFLLGITYQKTNSRTEKSFKKEEFILDDKITSDGEIKTLFKKEFKRYISSPIYVLNSGVGAVLLPILLVVMFLQLRSGTEAIDSSLIFVIITAMGYFIITITSTTSCTISLEGKQFWIIKSAPVKTENVFIAKALINIVSALPFLLIAIVLAIFLVKFSLIQILIYATVVLLGLLLITNLGLLINLFLPKMVWDQEVKVVKQSASVVVLMLLSFILDVLLFGASIIVGVLSSVFFGIMTFIILSVIINIIVIVLLNTVGKNKYERMSA
ncbi:MAG TPA: hypothetical protein PLE59_00890 [Bacteroidales bacterium]|nr:hypothetical protein [Bacteroidales bacterium]